MATRCTEMETVSKKNQTHARFAPAGTGWFSVLEEHVRPLPALIQSEASAVMSAETVTMATGNTEMGRDLLKTVKNVRVLVVQWDVWKYLVPVWPAPIQWCITAVLLVVTVWLRVGGLLMATVYRTSVTLAGLVSVRYHVGLDARKPVFGGLWITQAQTRLSILTVWSAPLLFAFWKVSYINLLQVIFQISSWSL